MENYTTTSGFSDLIGSMVVTNNNVDSYTSNTQGAGTIVPPGASVLRFTVRFGPGRAYNINATANGSNTGFNGTANNNGPALAEESWSATASTARTVDASTADTAYGSDDTATKKAAS